MSARRKIRQGKYTGAPQGPGKNERDAAAKPWHVVRVSDGALLSGAPNEAEARRWAAENGGEVRKR